MNAALRWILYGVIGGLGAVITYAVSLRFFPYVTIRDLIGPMPRDPNDMEAGMKYMMRLLQRPPMTTLGTTYGNVAYFLLGATLCGGIVGAIRWERNGPLAGIGWGVIAFFFGGAVSRALDAFSDLLTLASRGMIPSGLVWSFLVAMGIALAIGFLQGPTGPRMRRAIIAGAVAAIASYAMRSAAAPLTSLSEIGSFDLFGRVTDPRRMETINLWEGSRWTFLLEYVAMGIALGLSFAYVEAKLRRATLRLQLGKNEGETWELPGGPVMLGSAEGLPIRLPVRLGVAPRHASIVPHAQHGWAFAPEPGQSIAHNGKPTGGEWLRHGDRLGLGKATLVYEEANAGKTHAPAYVPPADPNATALAQAPRTVADLRSNQWLEQIDGRRIDLLDGVHTLGRDEASTVPLPLAGVSRQHAEIRVGAGQAMLTDLGSTNGTRVGGARVTVHELRDGDTIELGAARLVYRRAAF